MTVLKYLGELYPNLDDIVHCQGKFYRRRDSYWYEPVLMEQEISDIACYLLAQGEMPTLAKAILRNLELLTIVNPSKCNPPGYFPFKNGVIRWEWVGNKLNYSFIPGNLAKELDAVFLGTPCFDYEPSANNQALNRLLECLDEPFREILVRTLACALDLPSIRKFKSRIPKALLLYGSGANGKDALRVVLFRLFGSSCSAASIADFQSYDSGRKFGLADLELAKLNWASENAQLKKLDTIESLKLIVSGDPISIERKGIQEYRIVPQTVLLFNTNSVPKILASSPAIKTRYAIIPFTKTYTANPDPAKGELLADPRFKDDPQFIDRQVLPALFNLLLQKLQQVALEGIDYTATAGQLEQARANTSHLVQFCEDVGLVEDADGMTSIGDIWERLQDWYISEGFLTIEVGVRGGKKHLWEHPGADKCVQASHQLFPRLQELFPNIKRRTFRYRDDQGKEHKKVCLQGLSLTGKIGFQGFQDFQSPTGSDLQEQGVTSVGLPSGGGTEAPRNPAETSHQVQGSIAETPMDTAFDSENAVQRKPWNPIFQVGNERLSPGDRVRYCGDVKWIKDVFGDDPAVVVSHVNDCLYLENPLGGMDVPVLAEGWERC